MYQGETSMRVWDIIQLAGGVKENADTKQVNYSLKIEDQMVIYVPEKGEELSEEMLKKGEVTDVITKQENQQQKINLNQATEQELQNLTGIGQKKHKKLFVIGKKMMYLRQLMKLKIYLVLERKPLKN